MSSSYIVKENHINSSNLGTDTHTQRHMHRELVTLLKEIAARPQEASRGT